MWEISTGRGISRRAIGSVITLHDLRDYIAWQNGE